MTTERHLHPVLIGADWVLTDEIAEVRDVYTGELTARFCLAGEPELRRALDAAAAALAILRQQAPFERAAVLERVADGIRRRAGEFTELIVAEAGKPITLAEAEVARAEQTFRFAAHAAFEPPGSAVLEIGASSAGRGHTGLVRRFPLGIILAITPFNFPLNLVAHKLAPALATGNAVLLKPSPRTPLCSLLLGEVLLDAGMPPGQVNVVPSDLRHLPLLLTDGRLKMITFTGSARVGWDLKNRAGKAKVTLELGGNAAAIVHRDAQWRDRLAMFAGGAFGYAGQSCISLQRLYVHREIYAEFKDAFVAHVRDKVKFGDPRRRDVLVGPVIDDAARDRILAWVDEALKLGATLLTDLHPNAAERCLPPIVLEGLPAGAHVTCDEVFGPVVALAPYDDFVDAIREVNASPYGLQAGVFTQDLQLAHQAFELLEVGGVLINQVPAFRVENMPYGGVKDSGAGREGVRCAMEDMTEPRTLIFNLN
jgi:acyl-CoA reductase-like NAD-dependent aldehyde dehydrogenase